MKNLTLVVLAIICCGAYSCKKKQEEVLNTIKSTIDTNKVDIRQQYTGLFMVKVKQFSWYDTNTHYNAYDMLVYINYTSTDSIVWGTIAGQTLLKMPALSLCDSSSRRPYKKLGIDSTGKVYNQLDGFNIFGGGFVGKDILNCYFGSHGWHDGFVDTLVGHRL